MFLTTSLFYVFLQPCLVIQVNWGKASKIEAFHFSEISKSKQSTVQASNTARDFGDWRWYPKILGLGEVFPQTNTLSVKKLFRNPSNIQNTTNYFSTLNLFLCFDLRGFWSCLLIFKSNPSSPETAQGLFLCVCVCLFIWGKTLHKDI